MSTTTSSRTPRPPAPPTSQLATVPAPRRRWQLAAGVIATLLTLAATVATAGTPAYAATPQCTTQHGFRYADINGDKLLGVGAGFIDYTAWAGRPLQRRRVPMELPDGQGRTQRSVWELQSDINACYGSRPQWGGIKLGLYLAEDGDFGPATKAALIKVQQYHRITADGVYGPQTALAMRHSAWAWSGDIGTGTMCHTLGG